MQKYILVTGGTKGIGRAIIQKFAAEGFHIITCSRHEEELAKLKLDIQQQYTFSKVFYRTADLSDPLALQSFLDYVKSLKVRIDVLVNNTGVFYPARFTRNRIRSSNI